MILKMLGSTNMFTTELCNAEKEMRTLRLAIIFLFPTSFIGGISYYPKNADYPFNELNIYLFLIQLQFRTYEQTI